MGVSPRVPVERFYFEVWNQSDAAVAVAILSPDFRIRASLGPERHVGAAFVDYIHAALAGYAISGPGG